MSGNPAESATLISGTAGSGAVLDDRPGVVGVVAPLLSVDITVAVFGAGVVSVGIWVTAGESVFPDSGVLVADVPTCVRFEADASLPGSPFCPVTTCADAVNT